MKSEPIHIPGTAAAAGYWLCGVCASLNTSTALEDASEIESHAQPQTRCSRCSSIVRKRINHSLQKTLALVLTAAVLLIPANVLPITITDQPGGATEATLIGGVILLWKLGSYPIALVIFIASVVVPIGKLAALAYLCWSVHRGSHHDPLDRAKLYHMTELVGRWSMIDVFVVALLVALVNFGGVLAFHPGIAVTAFAGAVVATMLAAQVFDPRMLWDNHYR